MVAIFLHLAPFDFSRPSIILLIIAGSLCAILMAARIGISLWNRAEVRIFEENGLLKADITLAKPRQVRAGQFVFLRVPSTSALSINESHPFFIASWDQDKENKTRNITALIQRRKGFTRLLQAQPTAVRAFLEGPYGESPLAEDYGNVILFASGIGVAAHLGCIKQFLNALVSLHNHKFFGPAIFSVSKRFNGISFVFCQHQKGDQIYTAHKLRPIICVVLFISHSR